MRVSNAMMANNIQAYLFKHTESLLDIQERIASGKRINRPSDDPIGMGEALDYRTTIASLEQYNDNITDGKLHIDKVEDILDGVTDLISEAKGIAADLHPDMRDMMADQVVVIRQQVLQLANSKSNGNYIFNGLRTDTAPFDAAGVYNFGNPPTTGTKDYMIGDGLQLSLEAEGDQIFITGGNNIFDVLDDLETELRADNAAGITAQLPVLDQAVQTLNTTRAVNAGKHQRLDATENHNKKFKVNVQDLLSRTEDTDVVEAAIDLKVQQTAYESTLATAAQIVRPSLIDFLR
ncbi:MAG: flagellar hook-associated protein FlgL [Desulfatitalea sp.]|nr:flagellar hook-associated protein FlgL [Desulfatitalea sp.]NNJ99161.1 flagellar hook-associated protein FlgL [Desulfatitalea sp.]